MELPLYHRRTGVDNSDSVVPESSKEDAASPQTITLKERIKHVTWAWFTFPMSTGGIALLMNSTPHRFPGLATIGKVFYIFDICIFLLIVCGITTRFILVPRAFQHSLVHPTEGLFFPTFWLAIVDILIAIQLYGVPYCGPWSITTVRILFWIYTAVTLISGIWQYWHLFTAPKHPTLQSMTPAWILPIFPVMLCGTFANAIAADQPAVQRMPIIIAGVTFQGLGFTVSLLMFSAWISRLMINGLPAPNLRPGMFIAVGPPSFTGLAMIGLSNSLPKDYGYFASHPSSVDTLQTLALFFAIFIWALAFWFFCISTISVLGNVRQMTFHLVWWAFVFPNTGFTIATIKIGEQLESQGILWVASAMTILLVTMWLFVLVAQVRAVLTKQIMMPGKDEDKDEYREDDDKHGIPIPADRTR